jgi:hypothetical protein
LLESDDLDDESSEEEESEEDEEEESDAPNDRITPAEARRVLAMEQ